MPTRLVAMATGLVGVLVLGGCMSWETRYPEASSSGDPARVSVLLRKADALALNAGDRTRLQDTIEAYEKVVAIDGDFGQRG